MESFDYSPQPLTVFVELLYGCNLRCSYCYIGSKLNHEFPYFASTASLSRIFQVLQQNKVQEVVLLGGEPTLHPDFAEICRMIAKMDFRYRGVITNGIALAAEQVELLRETGFWVDISFRGSDSVTFGELTRLDKSFERALDAAKSLSDCGIPLGIEFDCVPMNYLQLYSAIEILTGAGVNVKQVQLHRVAPVGDAASQIAQISLDLSQWHVVLQQASRIQRELGVRVVLEDGLPYCLVAPEYWNMMTGCGCGFTLLTINPFGETHFCACRRVSLGNILNEPLSNIWEKQLSDYRRIDRCPPTCINCDLLLICRSGCVASSPDAEHPYRDVFSASFRPVRLGYRPTPPAQFILGQQVRSPI